MVLVLLVVVLAAVLAMAVLSPRWPVYVERLRPVGASRHEHPAGTEKLPMGAEAAIWAIVEVVPDPRNHLALTRDLTGEVRVTGTPLDPALRTADHAARPDTADDVVGPLGRNGFELWTAEDLADDLADDGVSTPSDDEPVVVVVVEDEPLDLTVFDDEYSTSSSSRW